MNSGIYRILNNKNGQFYIGSAVNLKSRMSTHFNTLRKNTHHNKFLQRAYNKYGVENFVFEILEYCEPSSCIPIEQQYIDNLSPKYNLCKTAGSTLGIKFSEEVKNRQSEARKGKPIHTGEWKAQAAERARRRTISDETRKKMSSSAKKRDLSQAIKNVSQYQKKGSDNPRALMNEDLVREIKLDIIQGLSRKELSVKYQVSIWNIDGIRHNKSWKHVTV